MRIIGRRRQPAQSPRNPRRLAAKSADAQFIALLRRKCLRAAGIGALTAASESIPGLRRVLGLVFGELLDAAFLAAVQRELIDETFALYGLHLPAAAQSTLVNKVLLVGTGASAAGDAFVRSMLRRALGRAGSMVTRRVLPIGAIVSSAFANATVSYAIGKRAQAVARLREAPIGGMPDVLRSFTGIDERRIFMWSLAAVKSSLGLIGKALGKMASPRGRVTPAKSRPLA